MRTACTDLRKGSLARTVFSREDKPILKPTQSSRKAVIDDSAFRRALKEKFQRDIDDTVEEIRSEMVNECNIVLHDDSESTAIHELFNTFIYMCVWHECYVVSFFCTCSTG